MTSNDKLYLSRREITNTCIDDIRYFMIFEYSFFFFFTKTKKGNEEWYHHLASRVCLRLPGSGAIQKGEIRRKEFDL